MLFFHLESLGLNFRIGRGIACSPDPIELATVLGPIKAEPCGWPREGAASLDGLCARRP